MEQNRMPLIGDMAPIFKAETTNGIIDFPKDYLGKWVVLFSHPGDFTPVCTTEFIAFATMMSEFKKNNTELIGLSVDSLASHIAWIRKIKELKWNGVENIDITFPIIDDVKMEIAKKYGMIHPASSSTKTVRTVFIIDPEGRIRAILYYPLTTGRNIWEIKRIVEALITTDRLSVSTPANWEKGQDVIVPAPKTVDLAQARMQNLEFGSYCLDWFLCFKRDDDSYQSYNFL